MYKFLKSIFENLIAQIIFTFLAWILASVVTYFSTKPFEFSFREYVLLFILLFFASIILSYFIYRFVKKDEIPSIRVRSHVFKILKEEIIHEWVDEINYIHTRKYKLRALQADAGEWRDKFHWTGSKYTLTGSGPNYYIEIIPHDINVYNQYCFRFKKPLAKGEEIEVTAVWNAKGPAKPFFASTIEEPTELLIMDVRLYKASGIKEINCVTSSYKGNRNPEERECKALDQGEFRWEIKSPKLLSCYEINWEEKMGG